MVTERVQPNVDVEEVREMLEYAGVDLACPACHHDERMIVPELVSVVPWNNRKAKFLFDGGYPSIMVVCGICGYTALFNAAILETTNA